MQMRIWLNHVSPIDLETAMDLICIITKKGILYNPDCVEGPLDLDMTQSDVLRLLGVKGLTMEPLQNGVVDPRTTLVDILSKKPRRRPMYHRSVKTFKLESEDWDTLIQFCKIGQQRYLSLVEFYQKNGNKPTSFDELSTRGLLTGKQGSFETLLCQRLLEVGYVKYAFKCSNSCESITPFLFCFAIME